MPLNHNNTFKISRAQAGVYLSFGFHLKTTSNTSTKAHKTKPNMMETDWIGFAGDTVGNLPAVS